MRVGAKHAPRIRDRGSKQQERCFHLLETCLIPIRDLERAWAVLGGLDRVLQRVDLLEFFLVRKINKEADNRNA
jgi:hypothetical protein